MSTNHLSKYYSIPLQLAIHREQPKAVKDPLQTIIEKKPPNKIVREYIKALVNETE